MATAPKASPARKSPARRASPARKPSPARNATAAAPKNGLDDTVSSTGLHPLARVFIRSLVVSRPYFYLVTLWLYLLPTGGRFELLSSPFGGPFWVGFAYCTYPLNLLCYLMNDLSDVDVDRENPRKGGVIFGCRGTAAELRSVVPLAVAANVACLVYFARRLGALVAAPWLAAVVLVNWLYNYGPRLSSNYAPLDLLCPCGYLLVIPLSCWLNGLPLPPARAWAHTVFFIVRSQLWIQTFDLDSDGRAGRRTTAVVLGLGRALQLLLALLVAETAFVAVCFDDLDLLSFSATSVALAGVQMAVVRGGAKAKLAKTKVSSATTNAVFTVMGLGGCGLLVKVWLNGSFN